MIKYYMLYILFSIFIIILFYLLNKKINFIENYNKIPTILFKTGPYDLPTSDLENIFQENKIKLNVSKVFYYNDQECLDLINTMDSNIIKAYISLTPTVYKADLWRYCVLYKYGGIYGDMTQKFLKNYDVNQNNADMILVKDISENAIQISFIATKPRNNFLKYVINHITNDILLKRKGINSLDITGPIAFCRYFKSYFKIKDVPIGVNELIGLDGKKYIIQIDLRQISGSFFQNIFNKKLIVLTKTNEHNKQLEIVTKLPKYSYLYENNMIYKD